MRRRRSGACRTRPLVPGAPRALTTRSFDCPSTTQPEHADGDDEQACRRTRRAASCGPWPAARPTARTSGLSSRLSGRRLRRRLPSSLRRPTRLRRSARSSPDHVRDQPLSVDPRDVQVGGGDRRHLAGLDVDEVALEVERAPVAVDRDSQLVRGVVGDPVVRRARTRPTAQPESPDLAPAPSPSSRARREASRSAPTGSSSGRCPSSTSPRGSSSRSGRSRSMSASLLGLPARRSSSRSSRRRPRAISDDHRQCPSDQEPPHRFDPPLGCSPAEPHVTMFTCRAGPSNVNSAR